MPAAPIRDEFGSKYVFLDKHHKALYRKLKDDPQAKMVYDDSGSYVFEVLDGG